MSLTRESIDKDLIEAESILFLGELVSVQVVGKSKLDTDESGFVRQRVSLKFKFEKSYGTWKNLQFVFFCNYKLKSTKFKVL